MKIFLFRFNSEMLIEAAREMRRHGATIAYWSASKRFFDEVARSQEFPDTIFHATNDAVRGIPAETVDAAAFAPLSSEIIAALATVESQVLTMMNGVDFERTSIIEKKRLYYEYVKYWYGVLSRMKPDAVFFGDIPHIAYQFIAYRVAQLLGIRTVMYRVLQITGRMIFLEDHEVYASVRDEVRAQTGRHIALTDLRPDIREYYEKQTNPKIDTSPFYMKKKYTSSLVKTATFLPQWGRVWKHLRQGTAIAIAKAYIQTLFATRDIASLDGLEIPGWKLKRLQKEWARIRQGFKDEYDSLVMPIDWSKKFVYVALHNQPECSTSAMGGIFADQVLMIDMLAAALPPDWVLYVKESPIQWIGPRAHLGRYPGYYRGIVKRKNVQLVSTDVSTYELINASQAVATVTGTAGWEGLLRGKPALIFGFTWFMYCHGAFGIQTVDACREAMQKISNSFTVDSRLVLDFVGVMDRVSMIGYPNKRFKGKLTMTDAENGQTIAREFLARLRAAHS